MLANLGHCWCSWVLHNQHCTHTWMCWPHLHICCSRDKRLPCTHQCWCHRSVQCSQGDSDRHSFLSLTQECTYLHLHREMTHRHWLVHWLLKSILREDYFQQIWNICTLPVEIHQLYQTLHKQCLSATCTVHVYIMSHICAAKNIYSGHTSCFIPTISSVAVLRGGGGGYLAWRGAMLCLRDLHGHVPCG